MANKKVHKKRCQRGGPIDIPETTYLPIDYHRPFYVDKKGNKKSEYKITISDDRGSFVIPTVWDGKQYTNEEAIDRFYKTGEHMGAFANDEDAERASQLRTFIYNNVPELKRGGTMKNNLPRNIKTTKKYGGKIKRKPKLQPGGNIYNQQEPENQWLTGAMSGASMGASIGSIIPGIGTAIGGIAGGLLGGITGYMRDQDTGEIIPDTNMIVKPKNRYINQPNIVPMARGGKLTRYVGPTHNYGGMDIGPAEVEGGETEQVGVVNSNSIKLTKEHINRFGQGGRFLKKNDIGKTPAQVSKEFDKKYKKFYPYDPFLVSKFEGLDNFAEMSDELSGGQEQEMLKSGGKWIQKATASIKRRGTAGKCTPITKPGCTGKARALALTFKKMARNRKKKDIGGALFLQNGGEFEGPYSIGDGYAVPGEMPEFGKIQRGNIGGPSFDILNRLAYNKYNRNYIANNPNKTSIEEGLLNTPNKDWYMNGMISPTIEGYRGVNKFISENPDYTRRQWRNYKMNELPEEGSFGSPFPLYGEYTTSSPERLMNFYKTGSTRWTLPGMYKRQQLISERNKKAKGGPIDGEPNSFEEAFREARDLGADVFEWKGKEYNTRYPEEMSQRIDSLTNYGISQIPKDLWERYGYTWNNKFIGPEGMGDASEWSGKYPVIRRMKNENPRQTLAMYNSFYRPKNDSTYEFLEYPYPKIRSGMLNRGDSSYLDTPEGAFMGLFPVEKVKGGSLTSSKAGEILRHGKVHGKALSPRQKAFFGWVRGGRKQRKAEGGKFPWEDLLSYAAPAVNALQFGLEYNRPLSRYNIPTLMEEYEPTYINPEQEANMALYQGQNAIEGLRRSGRLTQAGMIEGATQGQQMLHNIYGDAYNENARIRNEYLNRKYNRDVYNLENRVKEQDLNKEVEDARLSRLSELGATTATNLGQISADRRRMAAQERMNQRYLDIIERYGYNSPNNSIYQGGIPEGSQTIDFMGDYMPLYPKRRKLAVPQILDQNNYLFRQGNG